MGASEIAVGPWVSAVWPATARVSGSVYLSAGGSIRGSAVASEPKVHDSGWSIKARLRTFWNVRF